MSIRHDRDLRYKKSREKHTSRPKTFKTEESAKKYAELHGITGFKIENMKSETAKVKKLRLIF